MPEKTLHFSNARVLHQLLGPRDENRRRVEEALQVRLIARDDWLRIEGSDDESVAQSEELFELLKTARSQGIETRSSDVALLLETVIEGRGREMSELLREPMAIQTRRASVIPKTLSQKRYLQAIREHEVAFGIGPAGTGKTYLAVAAAIEALSSERVGKIILTRPAVEAGEALGFLPGDLREKIQPYLRPLFDALYDMMGRDVYERLVERGAIEVAPLAYMRGRTLSNAFIVLDEAQNTTSEQMMMFLTRLGEGSRMVVTGDITQVDLPRSRTSGLKQTMEVLGDVPGIAFFRFRGADVVRHPLVQRIIEAYEDYHQRDGTAGS